LGNAASKGVTGIVTAAAQQATTTKAMRKTLLVKDKVFVRLLTYVPSRSNWTRSAELV
jgi:hypothetical protein